MVGHGSLQNVFSDCIFSRARITHGGYFMVMSFLCYYESKRANGGIH